MSPSERSVAASDPHSNPARLVWSFDGSEPIGVAYGPGAPRIRFFDDKPVASASIGQVHKAVWSDGREVAVKIQYPGADEALRADLIEKGYARAREFSWARAAADILAVYREVAGAA